MVFIILLRIGVDNWHDKNLCAIIRDCKYAEHPV
jgi:hypothetical protein